MQFLSQYLSLTLIPYQSRSRIWKHMLHDGRTQTASRARVCVAKGSFPLPLQRGQILTSCSLWSASILLCLEGNNNGRQAIFLVSPGDIITELKSREKNFFELCSTFNSIFCYGQWSGREGKVDRTINIRTQCYTRYDVNVTIIWVLHHKSNNNNHNIIFIYF